MSGVAVAVAVVAVWEEGCKRPNIADSTIVLEPLMPVLIVGTEQCCATQAATHALLKIKNFRALRRAFTNLVAKKGENR